MVPDCKISCNFVPIFYTLYKYTKMINRALTRHKTVQILYAHYQNGDRNLAATQKELQKSLDESYELYQHMLALLTDIRYYAERRAESIEARAMRLSTVIEEKPADAVLAENKFLLALEQNEELVAFKAHRRELWQTGDTFLKRMTDLLTQNDTFMSFACRPDHSFDADRDIVRTLYKQFLMNNEDLDQVLEESSIFWNDDREVVDSFVLKTIKRFTKDTTPEMPLLPAYEEGEDMEFGKQLLQAAIVRGDEIRDLMAAHVKGWDFSRVALMDVLVMQLALAEILTFPEIPLNVSLNEYIDLAKAYSTPKSGVYVNGVLDAVVRALRAEGRLMK